MRKKQIEINGETFETSMSSVEIMLTTEVIELTEEYNNLLDSINKAKEIYLNGIEGSWPNLLAEKIFDALENINIKEKGKVKEKK